MTGPAISGHDVVLDEDISHLRPINVRQPLTDYLVDLWLRRRFLFVFASAQQESSASSNRLGRYWFVLSPILSAATYWFVFGVLLGVDKGIHNYVSYLVIGIFFFTFTAGAMAEGSSSLAQSADLIRSLHFPRAAIPLSSTILMVYRLGWEVLVVCVIVLITGEPITLSWLLLVPVVLLQTLFNAGLALILARLVAQAEDVRQLLPYVTRTWMFVSGVMFSITTYAANAPQAVRTLLEINPLAVYLSLARQCLITNTPAPAGSWLLAIVWGVGLFVLGFIFFWRAEASYGRV